MNRNVTASLEAWRLSSDRKPLILRGAPQVGNTYTLKEFGKNVFPRCHYVNFEEDERPCRIFEHDLKPLIGFSMDYNFTSIKPFIAMRI